MFLIPHIAVRETKTKGKGVFAIAEIPGGTPIGDYLGTVIPADSNGPSGTHRGAYDMWYSDTADICPDPRKPGVHLLNTSCEPNCAMTSIGRHTVLFALRLIFPGEELTYDYFLGAQEADSVPGADNCACGSHFCRGTLYSNPRAYAAWEAYVEEATGDEPEEPPVPYGEELPPLPFYPKTIPDHPVYSLFGSRNVAPHPFETEVLPSLLLMRSTIRETGRQLEFPALRLVVEGILYGGHAVMTHAITPVRRARPRGRVRRSHLRLSGALSRPELFAE